MANHTHTYIRLGGFTTKTVSVNPVFGSCGITHGWGPNNCILESYDMVILSCLLDSVSYETSEAEDTVFHTHTYTRTEPFGYVVWGILMSALWTAECGWPTQFYKVQCYSYAVEMSPISTSLPILNGDGSHYHTCLQARRVGVNNIVSLKKCDSDHDNCQINESETVYLVGDIVEQNTGNYPISPPYSKPVVQALPATNITANSAILNGKVTDDGGSVCEYRFRYRKGSGEYIETSWEGAKYTDETFSKGIGGLSAGRYEFAAQIRNGEGGS